MSEVYQQSKFLSPNSSFLLLKSAGGSALSSRSDTALYSTRQATTYSYPTHPHYSHASRSRARHISLQKPHQLRQLVVRKASPKELRYRGHATPCLAAAALSAALLERWLWQQRSAASTVRVLTQPTVPSASLMAMIPDASDPGRVGSDGAPSPSSRAHAALLRGSEEVGSTALVQVLVRQAARQAALAMQRGAYALGHPSVHCRGGAPLQRRSPSAVGGGAYLQSRGALHSY